jgi:BirA family biotin operon repressor/biotin-[acetyl-CoA-carboxylase] ligase
MLRRNSTLAVDATAIIRGDAQPPPAPVNDRDLLLRLAAGPASGEALTGAALNGAKGLSRAAVWKRVQALREAGIEVDARPGRGYALRRPLDLLDAEAIRGGLGADAAAGLDALEVAWSLDSTNSELLRRPVPARGGAVLLAERQSGGRGRRGRAWASPLAANLYLSVSRGFGGGLARLGGLSLVAGVASAEALHALGFAGVRLKWPNDLVVAEGAGLRKLGGLLVEGGGELAGHARAVLGLGLNVRMPEAFGALIDQPWIDLAQLAPEPPSRNILAAAVLSRLLPALAQFDREGLAPFLSRHAAFDALRDRAIVVQRGDGDQHGIARGIAEDGALRLQLEDDGEVRVHSGEVSVRTAPCMAMEAR